jgi:hypothetical protein
LRQVDVPDIGFDEAHLFIMAGSWGNDTNSHNNPSPLNANSSTAQGTSTRFLLFTPPPTIPVGSTVVVKGAHFELQPPILNVPAWTQPPGTLTGSILEPGSAPPYYRTRYIRKNNQGPATHNPAAGGAWTYGLSGVPSSWVNKAAPSPPPPHSASIRFGWLHKLIASQRCISTTTLSVN